jgi:hypothetical protein
MFGYSRRRSNQNKAAHAPAQATPCEPRVLPSGNVTISFTGPNAILIKGDGSDNSIEYISIGNQIIIQGYGTKVNGTPDGTGMPNRVFLTNAQGQIYQSNGFLSVTVDLGAGNDTFWSYSNAFIDLVIAGSPGNDSTYLFGGFAGQFHYGIGSDDAGNDTLDIRAFSSRQMEVNLGSGNDTLEFGATPPDPIQGRFDGGSGNDRYRISNSTIRGNVRLGGTDAGNDTVTITNCDLQNTEIDLGSGLDRLYLDNTRLRGNSQLLLGAGNDSFVSNTLVSEAITIDAGAGIDTLQVDLSASRADLLGGDGMDLIILNRLQTTESSLVDAGAGNDVVAILQTSLGGPLSVVGGTGRDTYYRSTVAGIGLSGFEVALSIWSPSVWLAGRYV